MRKLIAILPVLILSSGGCATVHIYQGEKLPSDKIAIIEGVTVRRFYLLLYEVNEVRIVQIDDTVTGMDTSFFNKKVAVLPGRHRVKILPMNDTVCFCVYPAGGGGTFSGKLHTFVLDTEAGHVYKAYCKIDGPYGTFRLWIVDKQTGKIVASRKPLGE
jgi:hypothetical protein